MRLAFSLVAVSIARNGIRFALRIVSSRDVAVITCDDPAVREVKTKSVWDSSKEKVEWEGSSTGELVILIWAEASSAPGQV